MSSFLFFCVASFLISCLLGLAHAEATRIEVFVDRESKSREGTDLTLPADIRTLRFSVSPQSLSARYKLEGLDDGWIQKSESMLFRVRFLNEQEDPIETLSFPVKGRSHGWSGSIEKSDFTQQRKRLIVPVGAVYISLTLSSAGPATLIGIYAVSNINITARSHETTPPRMIMANSKVENRNPAIWNKSGTHPSMANSNQPAEPSEETWILSIVDNDLSAHADWSTGTRSLPKLSPGELLDIDWSETYCIGIGGAFEATYDRVPAGKYRFIVDNLDIQGLSVGEKSFVSVELPVLFWKSAWFWGSSAVALTLLTIFIGRYLIHRKVKRLVEQAQIISEERRRIALDLHDDLGTRLSHISLLASHANSSKNDDPSSAFTQINEMSSELIHALSETVWMLNPKNNDLESLVDFLCRLASELCRLKKIRCRIDAMASTGSQTISHEFRHNMSLAVKESVNNALKHSFATEIHLKIELQTPLLKIMISDNGIGMTEDSRKDGLGLENLTRRMKSIRGHCLIQPIPEGGLQITLIASVL